MIVREANRVPPREGPGPQRGRPGFHDNGDLASRPRKEGGRRHPRHARDEKTREAAAPVRGTGLFCGVGAATRGLEDVGIAIEMGVDIDPACGFLCAATSGAAFLRKSVTDCERVFGGPQVTLRAGCVPCRPFSSYRRRPFVPSGGDWNLPRHFSRLAREARPDVGTMESVPRLEGEGVFGGVIGDQPRLAALSGRTCVRPGR